jgi:hypothetical protein
MKLVKSVCDYMFVGALDPSDFLKLTRNILFSLLGYPQLYCPKTHQLLSQILS